MPASFITGILITILNGLTLYRGVYCMYMPTNSGNESLSWSYNIHTKFHREKNLLTGLKVGRGAYKVSHTHNCIVIIFVMTLYGLALYCGYYWMC